MAPRISARFPVYLLLSLSVLAHAACPSRLSLAGSSWTLCRASAVHAAGLSAADLSQAGWAPPPTLRGSCVVNASVPTTAFVALLRNGSFGERIDPWVDDALLDLPDIANATSAFYEFYWTVTIDAGSGGCSGGSTLHLRQQNYRTSAWMDGRALLLRGGGSQAVGMFLRAAFDALDVGDAGGVHGLALLVLPPDHPGTANSGQGGSHDLAQDVVSQYFAGWDWVSGSPDRNCGLFDELTLEIGLPAVELVDAVAVVSQLSLPRSGGWASAADLTLTVRVAAAALGVASVAGTLSLTSDSLGAGVLVSAHFASVPPGGAQDLTLPPLALSNATLWWPHTAGTPVLHTATLTFVPDDAAVGRPSSLTWRLGLRVVESEIDAALGGRIFLINHQRLYITGGNYIAADLFNRHQLDARFYSSEVALHAAAGLNLLRLWGGAGGHGAALALAADEQGVLLLWEGPMSGDNNGRWAGSYDWPLDHALLLSAEADTMRSLRGHPSVLAWVAGNELFPEAESPPADIAAGLRSMAATLDVGSGRPLLMSSASNWSHYDPLYALAPTDGPYGLRDEREWFQRNPGQLFPNGSRMLDVPLAFQPEVGSVCAPPADSLARFLTPPALASFPVFNASWTQVHPAWKFYTYESYTDSRGTDRLYSYGQPSSIADWAAAGALVTFAQYRALYEGYGSGAWTWYGALVKWKTQSPAPTLRGCLYDSYLATNGGWLGVRAGTGAGDAGPLHIFLHQGNASVGISNLRSVSGVPGEGLVTVVGAWDVSTGAQVQADIVQPLPSSPVPAGGLVFFPRVLTWPPAAAEGAVLLWRLELRNASSSDAAPLSRSEYWLSNLDLDTPAAPARSQSFSTLGALRRGPRVAVGANVSSAQVAPDGSLRVRIALTAPAAADAVAFAIEVTLRDATTAVLAATGARDDRVLPAMPSAGLISLLPGETVEVLITASAREAGWGKPAAPRVAVSGWNVVGVDVPVLV